MARKESYLLRDLKAAARDARDARDHTPSTQERTQLPRLMLASLTPGAGCTTVMLALSAYFASSKVPPRIFTASADPSRPRTFTEILRGHSSAPLHSLPSWLIPGSMARFLLEKHAGGARWSLIEAPMGLLGSPNLPQPEAVLKRMRARFNLYDDPSDLSTPHSVDAHAHEHDTTAETDDPDSTDHVLSQDLPTGAIATLALDTACPIVVVIDVKSSGLGALATLKGLTDLVPGLNIAGLILNRVPLSQFDVWAEHIYTATGLPVLFTLPELPLTSWPDVDQFNRERTTMGRTTDAKHQATHNLNLLTHALHTHSHVNVEDWVRLADTAPPLPSAIPASLLRAHRMIDPLRRTTSRPFKLGVTRDAAFTDVFSDNLELILELGGEIEYMSPLEASELPDNLDGLLITGGQVEHYSRELSANTALHSAIRKAALDGLPIIAEGDGFIYLSERHIRDTQSYDMVGLVPGNTASAEPGDDFRTQTGFLSMVSRGYDPRTLQGETLRVYDQHHFRVAQRGQAYRASLPGGSTFLTGHGGKGLSVMTGHHFSFGAPQATARFAKLCFERHRARTGEAEGKLQSWKL